MKKKTNAGASRAKSRKKVGKGKTLPSLKTTMANITLTYR